MKQFIQYSLFFVLAGSLTFTACKKDDTVTNPAISVETINAGSIDLYGASSATGVVTTDNIVIGFSTNVDASSTSGITVTRGATTVATAITVSAGKVTVDPTDDLLTGTQYTLTISGVQSDKGEAAATVTVSFTTEGVGLDTPPQKDAQVMYLQLNGNVTDVTGNATSSFEQVGYATDRFGTANGCAKFNGAATAGTGDIVELSGSTFINPSTTVSVWFQLDPVDYVAGSRIMFGIATERGYFMEMSANDGWMKFATSHAVSPDPNSHYFGTAWTDPNGSGTHTGALGEYVGSIKDFLGTTWHQLVMTYDATSEVKTIYVDNVVMLSVSLANPPEWSLGDLAIADKADGTGDAITGIDANTLSLGYFCSRANTATGWSDYTTATNTFKGCMDDFRIFNKALTASEVGQLYNSEKN